MRSSWPVLPLVLNCGKMRYIPLPMLRISDGFSAAFGSLAIGVLFTLVKESSFYIRDAKIELQETRADGRISIWSFRATK